VPAYAATIHKSQGLEYPAVVIPVMTQHYTMLRSRLSARGVWRDMLAGSLVRPASHIERLMREQALRNGRDGVAGRRPEALLHHSDRGSQYLGEQFQRLKADHG
jgi:transposase InsO family protein